MGTAGHHGHENNKTQNPQQDLNVKNVTQRGNSEPKQLWKGPKCMKRQKEKFKTRFALPSQSRSNGKISENAFISPSPILIFVNQVLVPLNCP